MSLLTDLFSDCDPNEKICNKSTRSLSQKEKITQEIGAKNGLWKRTYWHLKDMALKIEFI